MMVVMACVGDVACDDHSEMVMMTRLGTKLER